MAKPKSKGSSSVSISTLLGWLVGITFIFFIPTMLGAFRENPLSESALLEAQGPVEASP